MEEFEISLILSGHKYLLVVQFARRFELSLKLHQVKLVQAEPRLEETRSTSLHPLQIDIE